MKNNKLTEMFSKMDNHEVILTEEYWRNINYNRK